MSAKSSIYRPIIFHMNELKAFSVFRGRKWGRQHESRAWAVAGDGGDRKCDLNIEDFKTVAQIIPEPYVYWFISNFIAEEKNPDFHTVFFEPQVVWEELSESVDE